MAMVLRSDFELEEIASRGSGFSSRINPPTGANSAGAAIPPPLRPRRLAVTRNHGKSRPIRILFALSDTLSYNPLG